MRHRKRGRKLGRTMEHRVALKRNLLKSLILHRRITTTLAKAKEYRPYADKLVTLARVKELPRVRRAAALLGNDRTVVRMLFDEVAPQFHDDRFPGGWRPGGYTRILKLPQPRRGDGAPMAILEFVGESERRVREAEAAAEQAATDAKGRKKRKAKKKQAETEPGESKD